MRLPLTGTRPGENRERHKFDEAIAEKPPVITWERDKHGVMRAVEIHDPHAETPNKPKGSVA